MMLRKGVSNDSRQVEVANPRPRKQQPQTGEGGTSAKYSKHKIHLPRMSGLAAFKSELELTCRLRLPPSTIDEPYQSEGREETEPRADNTRPS